MESNTFKRLYKRLSIHSLKHSSSSLDTKQSSVEQQSAKADAHQHRGDQVKDAGISTLGNKAKDGLVRVGKVGVSRITSSQLTESEILKGR